MSTTRFRLRQYPSRRRGMALIYAVVMVVVLMAFVSFGVDLGRVQLVKAELQAAADAAARAAAAELAAGSPDADVIAEAQYFAAKNQADGSSVVLRTDVSPSDVVIGNWDSSQTPKFDPARSPKNAVRITASRTAARG